MRINLSPVHSDSFSICALCSVLCAQSYHVAASRASGDSAKQEARQLLIPAVITQDASPRPSEVYFSWQMRNICSWSDLSITCVADYASDLLRWKLRTGGNLLIHLYIRKKKKVVFVIPDALKNHFRLSTLCEVFCLNGARRRQTTSLIRHRWRTADTTGTLGYLQE